MACAAAARWTCAASCDEGAAGCVGAAVVVVMVAVALLLLLLLAAVDSGGGSGRFAPWFIVVGIEAAAPAGRMAEGDIAVAVIARACCRSIWACCIDALAAT